MTDRENDPNPPPEEVTYYYDFIRLLEQNYAYASVESIEDDIKFARAVGPAIARLAVRDNGVFIMKSPIGRGDFAIIELEFDRDGVLQPVLGGILKR